MMIIMKPKIIFYLSFILIPVIVIFLSVSGCKKHSDNNDESSSTADTTELESISTDNEEVKGASEEAVMDANSVMSKKTTKSTESLPCNVTVDSSSVVGDTITYILTYNGYNCDNTLNRSGQVWVKRNIHNPWINAGATVLVILDNFEVTNTHYGDSFILNGSLTLKNVSGGWINQVGNGITSVTHWDWGAIAVTFDNSSVYTWNFDRQRVFSGTQGVLRMRSSGLGSQNGYTALITWGTTRMGKIFYEQIPEYVEHWENCYYHGASGKDYITLPTQLTKINATYGFDKNHNPLQGSDCPGSFRIDWTVGSMAGSFFMDLYP
jgi:hypothetical protein